MPSGNFELHHWRLCSRPKSLVIPESLYLDPLTTPSSSDGYTSLSELITYPSAGAAINSRTAVEIRIRNHLVKQAAYAYLQPTPSSTETSSSRRRGLRLIGSCFGFIGRFLRAIHAHKQR